MSGFVEVDGLFINKSKVACVMKYFGSGYDKDKHTCIFFSGKEDEYMFIKLPIEEVMEKLGE